MAEWLSRTSALLGEENLKKIKTSRIVLLGLGGVGSSVCEALCRCGISNMLIIDGDTVDITNLNRQIITNLENVGQKKCYVAKSRILSINQDAKITASDKFVLPDNSDFIFDFKPDYIIDAIDTMTAKLHIICEAKKRGVPIISCLGTGNRLHPELLKIGDITETSGCGCPVARVMRHELKKRDVSSLDVLFSTEVPEKVICSSENGRHSPASISFVPSVAGYLIASFVINSIIK